MEIDYVIAWVDGQDPAHIAARNTYRASGNLTHAEAVSQERYQDNGEIYYHLASILKYAPFIRRILLVTDNQKPHLLNAFFDEGKCDASFIKIVSHDEIFDGLPAIRPSFNARAIESTVWRIKDLSEHFIYANDDFFLNAAIRQTDFFDQGNPVLSGDWAKPETARWKYRFKRLLELTTPYRYVRPNHAMSQTKAAVLAGIKGDYFSVHHMPHPLRRSTLSTYFANHPDILNHQVQFRYRDIAQFNLVSLANNLEIAKGTAKIVESKGIAYIDHVKPKNIETALHLIEQASVPYGCVQGFEQLEPAMRAHIHHTLIAKFQAQLPSAVIQMLKDQIDLPTIDDTGMA
ncbi:Stealth CR1 domain-containing protein [Bartonella sp. LJL80]